MADSSAIDPLKGLLFPYSLGTRYLYAAGAYSVWFTGIESFGNARVSASIAVEMPSDATSRAELLQIEADFWGVEPDPDTDQRYMVFYFD